MEDCIFCKIIKRELPSSIQFENDSIIAFSSNKPVAQTHILVVPKKHIENFLAIKEEDKDLMSDMTKVSQELVQKLNIKHGYRLVFNGGKYQIVQHLHWHLLGGNLEEEWKNKI